MNVTCDLSRVRQDTGIRIQVFEPFMGRINRTVGGLLPFQALSREMELAGFNQIKLIPKSCLEFLLESQHFVTSLTRRNKKDLCNPKSAICFPLFSRQDLSIMTQKLPGIFQIFLTNFCLLLYTPIPSVISFTKGVDRLSHRRMYPGKPFREKPQKDRFPGREKWRHDQFNKALFCLPPIPAAQP